MTGSIIGHYRIKEEIAASGLYRAEDLTLGRAVALKFLAAASDSPAASALSHPNICAIHDSGRHEGRAYVVMELIEGPTLRERIGGRPLPLELALEWAAQIADALDAAHSRGIVHHKLSTDKIFVTGRGHVKVLGFEVAAPAGGVDRRSDLLSFGSVLYEMFTGGEPSSETPPSVRRLNPQAPAELDTIISKALESNPELRTQTAAEIRAGLRRLQRAQTPPRARRRFPVWAAAAGALAALAAAGWYVIERRHKAVAWKDATFTQLSNQPGAELYPSLSPDGKSIVYASRAAGNWDIYLQRVGGKNPINLTGDSPADDTQPAFSPDGGRIAFRSAREGGGLFVMGASGESVTRIAALGYFPSWSPDGHRIVCSTADFVWVEARETTGRLLILPAAGSASEPAEVKVDIDDAVQPRWSPHGRRIAFWSMRSDRDIWTVPAAGGAAVRVTEGSSSDWHPVWSPDGRYLYFLSDRRGSMNLWRVRINEDSGRVLSEPEQILTPSADTFHFSVAHDGRRIAYVNQLETVNIHKVSFDAAREAIAGAAVPVTSGSRTVLMPDVSPDGQWLAFWTLRRPENIFISRTDGSAFQLLTDDDHRDRQPRWSPDGKRLAFYSNRSGFPEIWTINRDGSGLRQITQMMGRGVAHPVWSSDGNRIVFSGTGHQPVIVSLDRPHRPAETLPPMSPAVARFRVHDWSSDGRRLIGNAVPVSGRGPTGVVVYSFDTRQYRHVTSFGGMPRWLSDNRRAIWGSSSSIWLLNTDTGKNRELLSVTPNAVYGVALSPDDRWIYFGLGRADADVWLMSVE